MSSTKATAKVLDDVKIHVRIKLSALWASVMFCYIYGDLFWLYKPGKIAEMLAGRMEPLGPTTQGVLLAVSMSMAIPSVMVFLSLALKSKANRWANIILGVIYSVFVLVTMPGAWDFYIFLGVLDIALAALIVWHAWKWPRVDA